MWFQVSLNARFYALITCPLIYRLELYFGVYDSTTSVERSMIESASYCGLLTSSLSLHFVSFDKTILHAKADFGLTGEALR
jgi:hypothetical protein